MGWSRAIIYANVCLKFAQLAKARIKVKGNQIIRPKFVSQLDDQLWKAKYNKTNVREIPSLRIKIQQVREGSFSNCEKYLNALTVNTLVYSQK